MPRFNKAAGLTAAARCLPKHQPKPNNPASAAGIAYERKVVGALAIAFADVGFDLSHNPWFEFSGTFGYGLCCPDVLLAPQTGEFANQVFVIEVKLKWVPEALEKLTDFYCPVISYALSVPVTPLVICRHLTPEAPRAYHTFGEAADNVYLSPLMQWLGASRLIV